MVLIYFFSIQAFLLKLVNFTATYFKLLYEKINQIDELLQNCNDEVKIEKEIKELIRMHVDALR